MLKASFRCLLFLFLFLSIVTRLEAVSLSSSDALSLSDSNTSISTVLSSEEAVSDLSKKAKLRVISSDKKLVKVRPAALKFDLSASELKTRSLTIFTQVRKLAKLDSDKTVTLTLNPNKAARKAGVEESSITVILVSGETDSLSVQTNFSGQALLPNNSSSLQLINFVPDFNANASAPLFLEASVPTTLNLPANAGSCALGLGGSPHDTVTGPGGADINAGSILRYGSGTSEGPLYIVFNNPNNAGANFDVDISSIPADLITEAGVPGFAQIYEGPFATGEVLATLEGTAILNSEQESFDLNLADGSVISYSKDGSKSVTSGEIASTLNDAGVSINQALGFLEGESLPISIPASIIKTTVEAEMVKDSAIANPVVTLSSDINGAMTLSANNINGSFTASGSINFDLSAAPDLGTQTLTGIDNFQMTIQAESPAIMTGFSLKNAKGNLLISNSDTSAVLQSISADFEIRDASISISNGISSDNILITNVEVNINQSAIPNDDTVNQAKQQCLSECAAQGGDTDFCNNLCDI